MKKVIYKGIKYKIASRNYGFYSQRLIVNGESSETTIDNFCLQNIEQYKRKVIEAIEEYITRKKTNETFDKWDGKLD